MIWFTADEHYDHANIIRYCQRPFTSVTEMADAIIDRHNSVVSRGDTVYHLGDFSFKDRNKFVCRLNGSHVFLAGNHDAGNHDWKAKQLPDIIEVKYKGQTIVLCHYAMRVWNKSHHGSWQLYGHSHGTLPGTGLQMDVGVDTNDFYPYSFDQIKERMKKTHNVNYFANLPGIKKIIDENWIDE